MGMNIGGVMFGVFCLILMVAGSVFVISASQGAGDYTDTYGNTIGTEADPGAVAIANTATESGGTAAMVGLVIVGAVLLLCVVAFGFYAVAKNLNQ